MLEITLNLLIKNAIAVFLVCGTSFVSAAGPIARDKIDAVSFHTGGFFLSAGGWGNPNECSRSGAVVLLNSDPNYDKAYALLLTAFTLGKEISGYSDGCTTFDGQTYNTIRGFKYLRVH